MMIPYARPCLTAEDIQAVVEVLQTDWLTQGPVHQRFEEAIAKYTGVRYAVSVSSGTAALHLLYLALGAGPGKAIWTSPNTFVATANAAYYCGAKVEGKRKTAAVSRRSRPFCGSVMCDGGDKPPSDCSRNHGR